MKKILIVIPAYNEEANINSLISILNKKLSNPYIAVIDDSESDETKKIIKINKNVKYFHRKKKLGRGSAVIYGFKKFYKKKY